MTNSNQAEALLDELTGYLHRSILAGDIKLSSLLTDGRANSSENERQISHALRLYAQAQQWLATRGLDIEIAPPRYWYDFLIKSPNEAVWLPVNVKVTTMVGNDNISSKEGLFYAVTGLRPRAKGVKLSNWEVYCESLASNIDRQSSADYYFIVVGKGSPSTVFWNSLMHIHHLRPNGNNPPFQCHWEQNQTRQHWKRDEAVDRLLSVLGETFRRRAEAYVSFRRHVRPLLSEKTHASVFAEAPQDESGEERAQ